MVSADRRRVYESQINSFIPFAIQAADEAHKLEDFPKTEDGRLAWSAAWNVVYHYTMDKMATEAGVRDFSWRLNKQREWRDYGRRTCY